MKNIMIFLSLLLFISSILMFALLGASGHHIDVNNFEIQIYLCGILLFIVSAIALLVYVYYQNLFLYKTIKVLLSIVILSFLFMLFSIFFDSNTDFSEAIVIIFLIFGIIFLCAITLRYLFKNPIT